MREVKNEAGGKYELVAGWWRPGSQAEEVDEVLTIMYIVTPRGRRKGGRNGREDALASIRNHTLVWK